MPELTEEHEVNEEAGEEGLHERLNMRLARNDRDLPGAIDMDRPARLLSDRRVFHGPIFDVEERRIGLSRADGREEVISRQLIRHAPVVVMLVHDVANDKYLLTREYRVGQEGYVYGLPAGMMDEGEAPLGAALRELREETGIVPGPWGEGRRENPMATPDLQEAGSGEATDPDLRVDQAPDAYSSEGFLDELAHLMVIHLYRWHSEETDFDPGEHVQSAWVSWEELTGAGIRSAKAIIVIQHEAMRRVVGRDAQGRV